MFKDKEQMNPTQNNKIQQLMKKVIAFKSLSDAPISRIAKEHNCCRNTVYKQQAVAKQAVDAAFDPKPDEVLFYIAITPVFIKQLIVGMFTICKSSYRDVQSFLMAIFTYDMSLGSIYNAIHESAVKAAAINNSYDLSLIKNAASDEMFRFGQPILTTVDLPSRYCPQLLKVDDRDGDSWAISIMEMMDQGFNPEVVVADGAGGIAKGYTIALPNTRLRYDHFHILQDITKAKITINKEIETLEQSSTSKRDYFKTCDKLILLIAAQKTFNTLMDWLRHDVLQLAGCNPSLRCELFDFIIAELYKLSAVPAILKVTKSLVLQREKLLDAANSLDNKFSIIAQEHQLPLELIWQICYLARYDYDSIKYQSKSFLVEETTGSCYEQVEDKVLAALENTYRSSSIIENLNGRVGVYLVNNKNFSQPVLDLIRCYLNHKPFVRSHHQRLKNKSPAEIMTGKPHQPFLQLLGFPPVTKLAA